MTFLAGLGGGSSSLPDEEEPLDDVPLPESIDLLDWVSFLAGGDFFGEDFLAGDDFSAFCLTLSSDESSCNSLCLG